MAEVTATPAQRQQLRRELQMLDVRRAARLSDSALDLLIKADYGSAEALQDATKESLTKTVSAGCSDTLWAMLGRGSAPAAALWRHPLLQPGHEMHDVHACTAKVLVDGEYQGVVVRITRSGICVSAGHVWVHSGRLGHGEAWGQQLTLLASYPYYDLIFLKGPEGPAFELAREPVQLGQDIWLVGYPLAPEEDLSLADPVVAGGHVVALASTGELAAGRYLGAMPGSSGGAVLFNSGVCAGCHLGQTFHDDNHHHASDDEEEAPAVRVDTDPMAMWQPSTAGQQSDRPDALNALELALHCKANIEHKGALGVFVPATFIAHLATLAKLFDAPALHKAASKMSSQASKRARRVK